jgi:hypothetical protein
MRFKQKFTRTLWLIPVALFLSVAIAFFGNNYPLNKTIREISLRLIQIQRLSRTRQIDYKVVFCKEHYIIDSFDKKEEKWKIYNTSKYRNGVLSEWDGLELIFSNGRLRDYRLIDQEEEILRYVIIHFYRPKSTQKKAIIFYRKGNWKVLI